MNFKANYVTFTVPSSLFIVAVFLRELTENKHNNQRVAWGNRIIKFVSI